MRNFIMFLGVLMMAGCVDQHSIICPSIKTYTKSQQISLLNDINNNKISDTGILFLEDYKTLRNEIKVCNKK